MLTLRRCAASAVVRVLAGMGVMGLGQAPAAAAPDFQVPFECGETVTAAPFFDHAPQRAVDFQRSDITGMPVLASASGTVTRVEDEGDTSYGRWIEIDHGSGWATRDTHLSTQEVSVGQMVSLGTKIGEAGASGNVTGPHLHYETNSSSTVIHKTTTGITGGMCPSWLTATWCRGARQRAARGKA